MKKTALGLNDMAIPGVPYANRQGLQDDDFSVSNRFFGKESQTNDENIENDDPIVYKRRTSFEEVANERDIMAEKYFEKLLKIRDDKLKRRKANPIG